MQIAELPPNLLAFIARLGIPLEDQRRDVPTWDGKTLHIARLRERWYLLHELAHYIAAPKALRCLPNFGLGRDPDSRIHTHPVGYRKLARVLGTGKKEVSPKMRAVYLKAQETAAAFLTGVLLPRFGVPWEMGLMEADYGSKKAMDLYARGAQHLWILGVDWLSLCELPPTGNA